MGNYKDGSASADGAHVLLDNAFGLVIQGAGGFIKYQNTWIGYQGSGDGDALALPTR